MKPKEQDDYVQYALFRKNLRRVRAVKGLTAKEFSAECKLRNEHRVAMLEEGRGTPSLDEVISIADATGFSTDMLLFRKATLTINWE